MRHDRSMLLSSLLLTVAGCGFGGGGGGGAATPEPALRFFDVFHEVGLSPGRMHVADVDCDGRVDIVTHCPGDSSISVERRLPISNLGSSGEDGVEIHLRHVLVPDTALDFCLGDFDMDGLPDLAVVTGDPDFDLLRFANDPANPGTFSLSSLHLVGGGISRVGAADINGDGLPDIVCLAEEKGQATLLLNDRASPGSFAPGIALPPFGGRSEQLILNDYDFHDSVCPNVIVLTGGGVGTIEQSPAGAFTLKQWLPANFKSPFRMAQGDVTGDGRNDLVLASGDPAAPGYCVLERDPSNPAGFRESPTFPSKGRCSALALADMNRDGRLDIVALSKDITKVSAITMRLGVRESPTRFSDEEIAHRVSNIGSSGNDGVSIAIADYDGDGFFDVFTELSGLHGVLIAHRIGQGSGDPDFDLLRIVESPQEEWVDVQIGDLNGDGRMDLATCGPDGITCHFQDPGSAVTFHAFTFAPGASVRNIAIGDVDEDGRADIAFATSDQIGVLWHSPLSAEDFDAPTFIGMGGPCRGMVLADLDLDGTLDIMTTTVVANEGVVGVKFGFAGRSLFPGATLFPAGPNPLRSLAVADLDCDGRPDLFCPSSSDDTLAVLRHAPGLPTPGPGVFLAAQVHRYAGGVWVAAGDVNGDGRADIVTGESDGATITLGDLDAPGDFQPSVKLGFGVIVVGGANPDGALVDLDNDGDLDVVATSTDTEAFRVMLAAPGAVDTYRSSFAVPHILEVSGKAMAVGDVDSDGWLDVVTLTGRPVGQPAGSMVHVWRQIPGPH